MSIENHDRTDSMERGYRITGLIIAGYLAAVTVLAYLGVIR